MMSLEQVLAFLPRLELTGDAAVAAGHGRAVAGEGDGPTLLVGDDGPIAIAEPLEDGVLKPVVGFRA
jgi:tRNA pseudouridine55 synthase